MVKKKNVSTFYDSPSNECPRKSYEQLGKTKNSDCKIHEYPIYLFPQLKKRLSTRVKTILRDAKTDVFAEPRVVCGFALEACLSGFVYWVAVSRAFMQGLLSISSILRGSVRGVMVSLFARLSPFPRAPLWVQRYLMSALANNFKFH